jgi:hypothetical protein
MHYGIHRRTWWKGPWRYWGRRRFNSSPADGLWLGAVQSDKFCLTIRIHSQRQTETSRLGAPENPRDRNNILRRSVRRILHHLKTLPAFARDDGEGCWNSLSLVWEPLVLALRKVTETMYIPQLLQCARFRCTCGPLDHLLFCSRAITRTPIPSFVDGHH